MKARIIGYLITLLFSALLGALAHAHWPIELETIREWLYSFSTSAGLGGVAALAAGRGAPLAPVYDDRPDSLVPAEGALGADDLRRVSRLLAETRARLA